MMTVWRVRGRIIRYVLCSIVCNNCAQCNAHIPHTNRPNGCLLVRFSFSVVILCCSLSVLDLALWDSVVSSIYLFFLV